MLSSTLVSMLGFCKIIGTAGGKCSSVFLFFSSKPIWCILEKRNPPKSPFHRLSAQAQHVNDLRTHSKTMKANRINMILLYSLYPYFD